MGNSKEKYNKHGLIRRAFAWVVFWAYLTLAVSANSAFASSEDDETLDELEERLEALLEEKEELESLEDKLEDDLEDRLEELLEAEEELEDAIEERLEEALDLEDELEDELENDLEGDIEDELEDELEDDLEGDIEEGLDEDDIMSRHLSDVEDRMDELYDDLEPTQFIMLLTHAQWQALQAKGEQGVDVQHLPALDLYLVTSLEPPQADEGMLVSPDHLYGLDAAPASLPSKQSATQKRVPTKALRRIGMMDSHIQSAHPCLQQASIQQQVFHDPKLIADSTHGTAMAGLMLASAPCVDLGVLQQAEVFNAVVFALHSSGRVVASAGQLIKGLDWLLQQQVELINLSLSGPPNPLLEQVLKQVRQRGVHLLASVGNDGAGSFPRYPAAYDSVMAITAVDNRLAIYPRAGQGDHVEFAAAGVELPVLAPVTLTERTTESATANATENATAFTATRTMSGTSLATALATAWIASLPVVGNVDEERERWQSQAQDLGAAGFDSVFGFGLLMCTPSQNCGE